MSNNPVRNLRKAIRLKFKSTIPNICKFYGYIRIWVPCTKGKIYFSERKEVAGKLSRCILSSGIEYKKSLEDKPNNQDCYFLIPEDKVEALTGYIRIYDKY